MFATIRHLLGLHARGLISTATLSILLAFECEARAAV
jgi:hypothetical protein